MPKTLPILPLTLNFSPRIRLKDHLYHEFYIRHNMKLPNKPKKKPSNHSKQHTIATLNPDQTQNPITTPKFQIQTTHNTTRSTESAAKTTKITKSPATPKTHTKTTPTTRSLHSHNITAQKRTMKPSKCKIEQRRQTYYSGFMARRNTTAQEKAPPTIRRKRWPPARDGIGRNLFGGDDDDDRGRINVVGDGMKCRFCHLTLQKKGGNERVEWGIRKSAAHQNDLHATHAHPCN